MSDQREGGPFPTIIVGHTELSNTARVTVSGEGLIIVTTTGLHLAPWEAERET